uniref:(northern house mosquito) hypothetical protein n=1 Tax=Culex pipiens TaxID=7175 RepID=A0A8D8AJ57_CULPI
MTFYKSQTSRAPPPASSRRASRPAFTGPASARPNPPKRAVPGDDRGVPRNVKASRRPSRRRDSSFKPSSCNRPKVRPTVSLDNYANLPAISSEAGKTTFLESYSSSNLRENSADPAVESCLMMGCH